MGSSAKWVKNIFKRDTERHKTSPTRDTLPTPAVADAYQSRWDPSFSPSLSESQDPRSSRTSLSKEMSRNNLPRKPSKSSLVKKSLLANDAIPTVYKYDTTFDKGNVIHKINGISEIWRQEERLGGGGYGEVYRQTSKNAKNGHTVRAVKSITRTAHRDDTKAITRELNALIALRPYTDNFVEFYCWYNAMDGSNTVFIAMEFLPAGDLYKYMQEDRELAKENCKTIIRQILQALKIMHENNICHRDLKPQNVLVASLSPLKVKLADFGIAKSTGQDASLMQTAIGSSKYIAPEVLRLNRHVKSARAYSSAIDMWALGTLAHEIMTGSVPFCDYVSNDQDSENEGEEQDSDIFGMTGLGSSRNGSTPFVTANTSQTFTMNLMDLAHYCDGSREFPFVYSGGKLAYSNIFKDFLLCVLYPDPNLRLSAAKALQHPWVNENIAFHPWYKDLQYAGQADAQHAAAARVESERFRQEQARAKIAGLAGVFKAARQFRRAVPRSAPPREASGGNSPRNDSLRNSSDQHSRVEPWLTEAESERIQRERAARARISGLTGVFRAARQFRRAVPRPSPLVEHIENEEDIADTAIRPSIDDRVRAARAAAEEAEQARIRSEQARARIAGLTGVFRARQQFLRAVPRETTTETSNFDNSSPLGGKLKPSVDTHPKPPPPQPELTERERMRRAQAQARISSLTGVLKAVGRFRRAVPRAEATVG